MVLTNWEFMLGASVNNENWPAAGCTDRSQVSYLLAIPRDPSKNLSSLCCWWKLAQNGNTGTNMLKKTNACHFYRQSIVNAWFPVDDQLDRRTCRHTCLHFGVVAPLRHLLLADKVINDPHSDWWLRVVPLHDDQGAAGLIGVRQLQPGDKEDQWQ